VTDEEFGVELAQLVLRRAAASHLVDTLAFVHEVAERLAEDPVFGEFHPVEYIASGHKGRNIRVHGITDVDDADGSLGLVIGKWAEDLPAGTLTTADVSSLTSALESFIDEAVRLRLSERITESNYAHEIARRLGDGDGKISRIRLHVFSNQLLSSRFKEDLRPSIGDIQIERHVWDLRRIKQIYESTREREEVEISLADFGSSGIPCLAASSANDLQSYLCVIDGSLLAKMYERYGSRLLEGNVRSFLGLKGGVNKGIRSTIQDAPNLFFAYNNGIAATASDAEVVRDAGQLRIRRLSDLQIVNGGQTTASILSATKKDGLSLENVSVPMKLTVVKELLAHELVPKIAEYANTQNKVSGADFFANHPFHRKMEEISRRLFVPTKTGVRVQNKWFYERSRGQYQNERLYLTKSKRDAFELEFPPEQVINKTDLAKCDSVWRERPNWVSLGAQKNFLKFADQFSSKDPEISDSEYWVKLSPNYGEHYYQRIIVASILWANAEKLVSAGRGDWYLGDYRAQIVAYALARVFRAARETGGEVDTEKIWKSQAVDAVMSDAILRSAKAMQIVLLSPPAGMKNVSEWAKKDGCWEAAKSTRLDLPPDFRFQLIERGDSRRANAEAKKQGELDDGIALQQQLLALAGSGHFQAMFKWAKTKNALPETSLALVGRASTLQGFISIASEKDWKRLKEIKTICEDQGFRGPL